MSSTVAPSFPTRWFSTGKDLSFSTAEDRFYSGLEPQTSWDLKGLIQILQYALRCCEHILKFCFSFRLSSKRRDDICMGRDTNRKLRRAARSCARSSRRSSCGDAKATLCIYMKMGWIGGGRAFRMSNVKKMGEDMPAFKRMSGGITKQGNTPQIDYRRATNRIKSLIG